MKYSKYLAISSAWLFYVAYGIYAYVNSDVGFFELLSLVVTGIFLPFDLIPTSLLALALMLIAVLVSIKKWRYKIWLLMVINWLYVGLIFFVAMALASV